MVDPSGAEAADERVQPLRRFADGLQLKAYLRRHAVQV
jgi:hypothetical protein